MATKKKYGDKLGTVINFEIPNEIYRILDDKKRSLPRKKTLDNAFCKICEEWKADREKELENG